MNGQVNCSYNNNGIIKKGRLQFNITFIPDEPNDQANFNNIYEKYGVIFEDYVNNFLDYIFKNKDDSFLIPTEDCENGSRLDILSLLNLDLGEVIKVVHSDLIGKTLNLFDWKLDTIHINRTEYSPKLLYSLSEGIFIGMAIRI